MPHDWLIELRCPACDWQEVHDLAGMTRWLVQRGQLRNQTEATAAMIRELSGALAGQQDCPACRARGLVAREVVDDWSDLPTAVRCETCGQLIAPERLEVFPDTRRCAACQAQDESGKAPPTQEWCRRCGAPLVLKSASSGVHRYVLVCSGSPPCRGA